MDELQQDEQADQRMAERLLRGGVGLRHVRRTLRELRDHRADLVARLVAEGLDRGAAIRDARVELGDRDVLAAQMLARPELRSRARRFAWLWFLLAPMPMVFVVGLVTMFGAVGLYLVLGVDMNGRTVSAIELRLMQVALQWVAPAIVGLVLARLAVRRAVPAIYPLCTILLVALSSSSTYITANLVAIGWAPFFPARGLVLFCGLGLAFLVMCNARLRSSGHA